VYPFLCSRVGLDAVTAIDKSNIVTGRRQRKPVGGVLQNLSALLRAWSSVLSSLHCTAISVGQINYAAFDAEEEDDDDDDD
jgi:hypothetical protein